MFEKYTERARRVIFFARYEASQLGKNSIETEHLLLGLLREGQGLTARMFAASGIKLEGLRKEMEMRTGTGQKVSTSIEIPLSSETKRILAYAAEEAEKLAHGYIGTEHILLGILRERKSLAARLLQEKGLKLAGAREEILRYLKEKSSSEKRKETPFLTEYSRDLTELAARGELDPLVGRDRELERVIQILCRRSKSNPVLIGEPGVGKTAIVEGLAQKIIRGEVPPVLRDKRIFAIDISSVVAGTKYRGQFEERLKTIMKELRKNDDVIVFIDELHTLVGAGSAEGSLDAAGILKPALSRGEVRCIGATTPREYRKHIEKDRALERRFQGVKVDPPGEVEALQILEGVRARYEDYHSVDYDAEAVRRAVIHSNRYISDRCLPDKAIDVLDEAGARVKLRGVPVPRGLRKLEEEIETTVSRMEEAIRDKEFEKAAFYRDEEIVLRERLLEARDKHSASMARSRLKVGPEDIDEVISSWTGIPTASIQQEEQEKLLNLEGELKTWIVGQAPALAALSRAIRRSRAGLKHPSRPVGSFLFLGPTGVGKTEVARRLAQVLFGSSRALIRFDMSEFMERHSVSKLIGSPPGYVGYEEGGQLTDQVKRNPYSIVLLDEIEKAHPQVFNILLQVFEDGILSDGLGNTVDFRHTILILTSNIGARHIEKRPTVGFSTLDPSADYKQMRELVLGEVKKTFNPEFINRLDEVIVFNGLGDEELLEIVRLMVEELNRNLQESGIQVQLSDSACRWFLTTTCKDRSYGARPLRRALQEHIEDPLAEEFIRGAAGRGGLFTVDVQDGRLVFQSRKSAPKVAGKL